MDSKRTLSPVFNSRHNQLRWRPESRWWNCVQMDINKCKITNWKER